MVPCQTPATAVSSRKDFPEFRFSESRERFPPLQVFNPKCPERETFVEHTKNYGLIIWHLRKQAGFSVQKLAEKIGRSAGWLSEVENSSGACRLTEAEFERIVALLDGGKHREMFRTWVANHHNAERVDRTFDGAVIKCAGRSEKGPLWQKSRGPWDHFRRAAAGPLSA